MKNFTFLKRPKKENALASARGKIVPTRENHYSACHNFSVWNIFFKISDQNSHLLSQNVFLQSIIYPTKKIVHWNKQHFGSKSCAYGCYTELKELFGWTNIWQISLLVGHRKHPFPWAATPMLPSAPILKQIPILARANPGNQHPSFYSESFRNLFITRGTEYREWLVENIIYLLDSLLTACIEI